MSTSPALALIAALAYASPDAAPAEGFDAPGGYAMLTPTASVGVPKRFGGRVGIELGKQWANARGFTWTLGGQLEYGALRHYDELSHQGRLGLVVRFGGGVGPWFLYTLFAAHPGFYRNERGTSFTFGLSTGVGFWRLIGARMLLGAEVAPCVEYVGRGQLEFAAVEPRLVLGLRF